MHNVKNRKELAEVLSLENGTSYKQLEISLKYDLGGQDYWNGGQIRRGYYAYFSPCNISGGSRSSTLGYDHDTSGFKVLLEETNRMNFHVMKALWSQIFLKKFHLRNLFQQKKYGEIDRMLKSL